ncbi:hypothetical protein [Phormidium pseudopriestleyi]|uniref:hypothetical protein n=1 Tax=Phormidium pseudopriestleyi TaxID=1759527 RepID=UPI001A8F0024|nr:hypothetical protein [Phormidium pseudopriestleyi]
MKESRTDYFQTNPRVKDGSAISSPKRVNYERDRPIHLESQTSVELQDEPEKSEQLLLNISPCDRQTVKRQSNCDRRLFPRCHHFICRHWAMLTWLSEDYQNNVLTPPVRSAQ